MNEDEEVRIVRAFIDWLIDECPVRPDQVSRERLVALWADDDHVYADELEEP